MNNSQHVCGPLCISACGHSLHFYLWLNRVPSEGQHLHLCSTHPISPTRGHRGHRSSMFLLSFLQHQIFFFTGLFSLAFQKAVISLLPDTAFFQLFPPKTWPCKLYPIFFFSFSLELILIRFLPLLFYGHCFYLVHQ